MDKQLELVAQSYDKAIEFGRKGIDLYKQLPEYITSDPDYHLFEKMQMEGMLSDSASQEIIDYLSPSKDMNFIDLGCCLNLIFRGYDKWPSTYYGVDISSQTIQLLHEYVAKNRITWPLVPYIVVVCMKHLLMLTFLTSEHVLVLLSILKRTLLNKQSWRLIES